MLSSFTHHSHLCPITLQNLGHLTLAPKVGYKGTTPIIHLTYSNGDKCGIDPTKKYHTDIFLTCAKEHVSYWYSHSLSIPWSETQTRSACSCSPPVCGPHCMSTLHNIS